MIRRAKVAFVLASGFFLFFILGITDKGQELLRGRIPPNVTHWQLDDIYMGAGLAPVMYGLIPSFLLVIVGSGFLLLDWRSKRASRTSR